MTRFLGAVLGTVLVFGPAPAEDAKDAKPILDKAIKALGGEEKLAAVKAAAWKGKGKINFGGNESNFNSQVTVEGLDRIRSEFEGDFGGMAVKGALVLNGDKGWRKFGDMTMELDK